MDAPGVMTPICYKITGPGPKFYVGKTIRKLAHRWQEHRKSAEMGKNTPLYAAMRKHGADVFVVECIATAKTEADAFECERIIIRQMREAGDALYNLADGGEGPVNMKLSDATRAKMSQTRKGRKHSKEHREAIASATKKWWAGREPTEAQRRGPTKIPKAVGERALAGNRARWAAPGARQRQSELMKEWNRRRKESS